MTKPDPADAAHFVDDYLPALLAQASHLISGEFHRVVRAKGFTVSEWRVLATLASGDPISIGRLAEITVTKQPTVTRVLDRMEARGQVQRLPHETDRRVTLVGITPAGARLVSGLIRLAREHEHELRLSIRLLHAADGTLRWVETAVAQAGEIHSLLDRMLDIVLMRTLDTLPLPSAIGATASSATALPRAQRVALFSPPMTFKGRSSIDERVQLDLNRLRLYFADASPVDRKFRAPWKKTVYRHCFHMIETDTHATLTELLIRGGLDDLFSWLSQTGRPSVVSRAA